MRRTKVEVFSYASKVNEEGGVERELVSRGLLSGIIVPAASEMTVKEYGFDENLSYRFYCKRFSEYLCAGNVIRYEGRDYNITHVHDYRKAFVAHLRLRIV